MSDYNELIQKLKLGDYKLSPSSLREFGKSPKHFIEYKLKVWETSEAAKRGTLVHAIVLDQEHDFVIFDADERPEPKKTFNSKENKAWKAAFYESHEPEKIIEKETFELAERMANAVLKDPYAYSILEEIGETEKYIQWQASGVDFHGYVDGVGSLIMDLKTCRDASFRKFRWEIKDKANDMQLAMYRHGLGMNDAPCYNIAVDTNLHVSVIEITEYVLREATERYLKLTEDFKTCVQYNLFSNSYGFHANRSGVFQY